MKKFLEVSVSGSADQRELLIPSMVEMGCAGFEETPTHLIGYFPIPSPPGESGKIRDALTAVLRVISVNAEITFREIEERNWNLEWEQTIGPIDIGDRITVKPSWREYHGDADRIVLTIDPKMSFGTGYHETTRLMVRMLEKYILPGSTVLDVGTGTGILAIASVKLGAGQAYGTDTDEWSVENAIENVSLNGVEGVVSIYHATFPPAGTDAPGLICANLTLNDLKTLLGQLYGILGNGGLLLASGLLDRDEPEINDSLRRSGFRHIETMRENEWLAICSRK